MRTVRFYPEAWPLHSALSFPEAAALKLKLSLLKLRRTTFMHSVNVLHTRIMEKVNLQ